MNEGRTGGRSSGMSRWSFTLLILFLCATCANAQVGTPIPSGQTVTVDAHGECRQVTNPGSGTRMVFTSTAPEWTSFIDNPNGLTMAACAAIDGAPCGLDGQGVGVGGYCWYLGGGGQSCTQVCASRGGVNMEGTRDFAGSGGTLENCMTVQTALNMPGSATTNVACVGSEGRGHGCSMRTGGSGLGKRYRCYEPETKADDSIYYFRRFCACGGGSTPPPATGTWRYLDGDYRSCPQVTTRPVGSCSPLHQCVAFVPAPHASVYEVYVCEP